MSQLQYFTSSLYDSSISNSSYYSQAVRIPRNADIIKISGQGGWDPETGDIEPGTSPAALAKHIAQAFANVDRVLRAADSKNGWGDVYLAHVYSVGLLDEGHIDAIIASMKKWCPNHRPCVTAVEVPNLALDHMRIEVEVEAYVDEGRK